MGNKNNQPISDQSDGPSGIPPDLINRDYQIACSSGIPCDSDNYHGIIQSYGNSIRSYERNYQQRYQC